MKKILLDTDIGTDIDDALALCYLLSNPECELLGITTVTGEPEKRALLAQKICFTYNKNIPIYPGLSTSLNKDRKQLQPVAQQAAVIDVSSKANFPQDQAISFLQKTIRDNPHEITLLGIGPLTNIAALFTLDSEIPALLKELVLMS